MAFRKLFGPGAKVTFTASADITAPGFVKIAGDRAIAVIADPQTDASPVIGAIERPDVAAASPVLAGQPIDVTLDAPVFVVPVTTAVTAGQLLGNAGVVIKGAAAGGEAEVAMTRKAVAGE